MRRDFFRLGVRLAVPLALVLGGCAPAHTPADWVRIAEITPAFLAERHAIHEALATDAHGRVALTFVTRDSTGTNVWLAVSSDSGATFGAPQRVNERMGAAISYAEARPMAAFGEDGRLAVVWTEKRADSLMAADVFVRGSGDGGATLGPIARVNDDFAGRPAYHGFPALGFARDGALIAAWMDERDNPPGEGEAPSAALYSAVSRDGGQRWSANHRVTDRLCPCCRVAIATTADGAAAILYRSSGHDLRDPALAVSHDEFATVTLDTLLSPDGWQLNGCPVEGPALIANRADGGMLAWYTGAGAMGVFVAPWRATHGLAGVKRAVMDSLADAGHVRLAPLGAGALLAVEARATADTTRTVFAVRALRADGTLTPWSFLGADVEAGAIASVSEHAALAAWTEKEATGKRVRIARLTMR